MVYLEVANELCAGDGQQSKLIEPEIGFEVEKNCNKSRIEVVKTDGATPGCEFKRGV